MASPETKDFLEFVIAVANGVAKSSSDGSIGLGDIAYFIDVLKDAPAAMIGAQKIPAELIGMSDADRADLLSCLSDVDTGDKSKDLIIQKAVMAAVALVDLILHLKK